MISNEHIQVLQTLLNNGYINPEATDSDIQNLLNDGHTLRQLKGVTEEQARIAQRVIDTGEPYYAQTAEGPINMQPDEANDYLNEALRIWLGVVYWENTNTNFTHITNPTILRMVEQYGAGLTNQDDETLNPPEQDTEIIRIPEDVLAAIHGELFDLAHLEERQSLLRRLDAFALNTLGNIIERYNEDRLPAGSHTRGISNEWWNAALDAFTGIYAERNINLTAEALRAALDQLTELERMRIREDAEAPQDVEIIRIPEDDLVAIRDRLFDSTHPGALNAVLYWLETTDLNTLERLIERYSGDGLPAGNYARGLSNEYWGEVLDAFTSFYTGRGVSLTAEALRAGLDQLVELVRLRMPEDEADNHNAEDDDLDEDMLEDMAEQIALEYEEEPPVGVAMYMQLLDEHNEGYDTLDLLVDWYLANSRPDTLSRISNLDYASVISMFEGLEEYQHNLYRQNNPEDPDLIYLSPSDVNITPETLAEYLNHEISLAASDDEDIQKPRTINSIIMKGW